MKTILIYGPHADEYSLSKINRGLALALKKIIDIYNQKKSYNKQYKLVISGLEKHIGKIPSEKEFQTYPLLQDIYETFNEKKHYNILIYNNFPKDPSKGYQINQIKADIKIGYFAWEESIFPKRWVKEFNENFDILVTASIHTKIVFKRSGIKIPLIVIPNALDDKYFDEKKLKIIKNSILHDLDNSISHRNNFSKSNFTFFHNSSGMERKGIEELIKAFTSEFQNKRDVKLKIKSFANANNIIKDVLQKYQSQNIDLIESNSFSEKEMIKLYLTSDAYVSPSRAEGFNLPVLEAMSLEIPVITTAWGGHMDFCNDNNSFLLDYDLVPAVSHLDNSGAYWAQVRVKDLRQKMQKVVKMKNSDSDILRMKIQAAKKTAQEFKWKNSAQRFFDLCKGINNLKKLRSKNLCVLSTYNSKCGIAEYSKQLYDPLKNFFQSITFAAKKDISEFLKKDDKSILRLWSTYENDFDVFFDWFDKSQIDLVHIQYNFSFFSIDALKYLIEQLLKRKKQVILTAHAIREKETGFENIKTVLKKISQIHVLNKLDKIFLEKEGFKNVNIFSIGNRIFQKQSKSHICKSLNLDKFYPIIGTHGFMVEKKGIFNTLKAVAELKKKYPDILYIALNATNPNNVNSQKLSREFLSIIKEKNLKNNVIYSSKFLKKEEIITALSVCDVNVYAYDESTETASAAFRPALAAQRPIIASRSSQLNDIQDISYIIDKNSSLNIANAVEALIHNPIVQSELIQKMYKFALKKDWDMLAFKYVDLVSKLY